MAVQHYLVLKEFLLSEERAAVFEYIRDSENDYRPSGYGKAQKLAVRQQ